MDELRVVLGHHGRLVIPVAYRKALGLEPGDEVVVRLREDELQIVNARHGVGRAKRLVRQYTSGRESLADQLIAERRAEAKRGTRRS